MTRQTDLAWAAGFVDGEGCFSMKRRSHGTRFGFRFTVNQIDRRPLDRLAKILGRGVVKGPRISKSAKHSPVWRLDISGKHAITIYELLEPYLSEPKREQAIRVLDQVEKNLLTRDESYDTMVISNEGDPHKERGNDGQETKSSSCRGGGR